MFLQDKVLAAGISPGLARAMADAVDSLTATGTTQADAYELRNSINRFTTVASGSGAKLWRAGQPGDEILVYNAGANALLVYPDLGASIDSNATNASVSIPAGTQARFTRHNGILWSMQSESAADLIFTQSGIGAGNTAASRTMQAKAREVITSEDFTGVIGTQNVGIGAHAMRLMTSAARNTAIGEQALQNLTTGNSNVGVGGTALERITTGSWNVAVGVDALVNLSTGSNATAIGTSALSALLSGDSNTAVGLQSAQFTTTGQRNVAVGTDALQHNTTGSFNVAIGATSLQAPDVPGVSTGSHNVAIGDQCMNQIDSASFNTAVGDTTLYDITTGQYNTCIGYNTGRGITTGSKNTIIGSLVSGLAAGLANNVIIADGDGTVRAQHDATNWTFSGNGTFSGSLKTSSPNTSAQPMKFGSLSVVSPTSPNRTLEVSVNGTIIYIACKTTND
jgi:hypothetical protein